MGSNALHVPYSQSQPARLKIFLHTFTVKQTRTISAVIHCTLMHFQITIFKHNSINHNPQQKKIKQNKTKKKEGVGGGWSVKLHTTKKRSIIVSKCASPYLLFLFKCKL